MKLMLISIVILVALIIVTRALVKSMSVAEQAIYVLTGDIPKRCIVSSLLLFTSFIETVVSVILFIIKL